MAPLRVPRGTALVSRLPQIIQTAESGVGRANAQAAQRVARGAKGRAPRATGRLAGSIKAKPAGGNAHRVEVGAFYGMFIEWGTIHQGARPFLTPAAEAERASHLASIRALYR